MLRILLLDQASYITRYNNIVHGRLSTNASEEKSLWKNQFASLIISYTYRHTYLYENNQGEISHKSILEE